jgi:hypothetical protein
MVSRKVKVKRMDDQAKQRRMYQLLMVVFGIAGVVWIVYGFLSPRFILYPLIGVANLGIAWFCKQSSA